MNKTVYDEGVEKGIEQGIEQGRLRLIEESLTVQSGPFPEQVRERLRRMSAKELVQLTLKIGTATSFADLDLEDSQ